MAIQQKKGGTKVPKHFDEILENLNGFGRFQWVVLGILLSPEIPASFVAFSPIFAGRYPEEWQCTDGKGGNNTNILFNKYQICDCSGLRFSDISSIVSEWNLICDFSWASDMITSIQMLGMLVGSLFSSQISDRFGRKYVYIGICALMALGQIISALSPNPFVYAASRFIAGAGLSGFMGVSTVYPMEFLTPKWRFLCGCIGPWGMGIMLFSLLSYLITSWRLLLLASAVPFLSVLLTVPFLPESPRWLIIHERYKEAEVVLRFISKVNLPNQPFTYDSKILTEMGQVERNRSFPRRISYAGFFSDRELRSKTLILMGIWFSWSLVYFGISYNITSLKGNLHWNVFFMGLADAIGYPGASIFTNRLGRRKALIISMTFAAAFLASLAALVVAIESQVNAVMLSVICLTGRMGVASARSSIRILTSESFPTNIRTMGYGISGVTAGVGGVIAPQIGLLGSRWWAPLPFVTFGLISIFGSVMSLALPETAGASLQESRTTYGSMTQASTALEKSKKNCQSV